MSRRPFVKRFCKKVIGRRLRRFNIKLSLIAALWQAPATFWVALASDHTWSVQRPTLHRRYGSARTSPIRGKIVLQKPILDSTFDF
jgi:hypothetical protein